MSILDDSETRVRLGAAESVDALTALHTLSVDTRRGFEKMVEKADADFQPIAHRFSALHDRHVGRLNNMVREMGNLPHVRGSVMGTLNTTVITLRAVFDAVDSGVMDQVRKGEHHVLAAFDRALISSLPQGHRDALAQMKGELITLLDKTLRLH